MNASVAKPVTALIEAKVLGISDLIVGGDFAQAFIAANSALAEAPDSCEVLYLLSIIQRNLNRLEDALATLTMLAKRYPDYGRLFEERGHCYQAQGNTAAAISAYEHAVDLNDTLGASWQALQSLYKATGKIVEADHAGHCLARLASLPPVLRTASSKLNERDLDAAEEMVRSFLRASGNHIEGMRLLAQIAIKREVYDDAEFLLENIVALAPDYHDAGYEYALVLSHRRRHLPQLLQAQELLRVQPQNCNYRMIYAQARDGLGEYDEALRVYRELLAETPENSELHLLAGHALRTCGQQQAAIESYHAAIAATPAFGGAYLGLANMKTYRFPDDEVRQMRAEEAASSTSLIDKYFLCFAIGKALEDRAEYTESFSYYKRGNALKRSVTPYKREITERSMRLQASVCTSDFFALRKGFGCGRPDPIFIVGLPRSGSTLIEQILASHSKVDGTMELPDIPRLAYTFRNRNGSDAEPRYPAILAELSDAEFKQMGETYIEDTRIYRRGAPFFIDKMPSNFREIGLIHLILPNAKIIDARREPMACCFGNFKQLFTRGQEFTYDLEDLGRYYCKYVELMNHWDRALPGKVLRVRHEDVVDDLEGSVHRILDYCGLEFEPACLEFYKTARSVRTVSSEQVRRPIFREGLTQWRHFEPWLEPLRQALEPLVSDNK